MKKLMSYLFLLSCLFGFTDVFAVQNVEQFSNLTIADSGMIYDYTSNSNYSPVGYSIEKSTANGVSTWTAFNTLSLQTVYNSWGAGISQCGMSFLKDNYYSVTFYFDNDRYNSFALSPEFTTKTYKLGIHNSVSGYTNFNYETVESGTNVYIKNGEQVAFYTVIFKAPVTGTCLTSAFSTSPTYNFTIPGNDLAYLGYNLSYLGDKELTASDIQNILDSGLGDISTDISNSTSQIQDSINQGNQVINDNINDLKDKQEEQNQTSKGIWATLRDGLGNIGNWFSSLTNSIGGFFGDLTSSLVNGFLDLASSIGDFFVTLGNIIVDGFSALGEVLGDLFAEITSAIGGFFGDLWEGIYSLFVGENVCYPESVQIEVDAPPKPFFTFNSSEFVKIGSYGANHFESDYTNMKSTNPIPYKDFPRYIYFTKMPSVDVFMYILKENQTYAEQYSLFDSRRIDIVTNEYGTFYRYDYFGSSSHNSSVFKYFAFAIYTNRTGNPDFGEIYTSIEPTKELVTVEEQVCKREGGLFGVMDDFKSSVGNWFNNLLTGILDGIKALFVPTDEQLYEIINESSELTENFGFVGESINFFLTIFTSLLGLVNANGCVELPEFTIGETSLFDRFTFWESQNVCLGDNVILSKNITTIRTITSIVLVAMFINFASSKFFDILSKNDSYRIADDSKSVRSGS